MICKTYLTAGARLARETAAKPAARTAAACSKPMINLIPSGIESTAGLPMSNTRKKNQSVPLSTEISQYGSIKNILGEHGIKHT